jgi:hypothetical protein
LRRAGFAPIAMFVYVGTTYTSQATGSALRTVVCERCKTRYHYVLPRRGLGAGIAHYGYNSSYVQQSVAAQAQHGLHYHLQTGTEMVPCPKCQWVSRCLIPPGCPDPNVEGLEPKLPTGTPLALAESFDSATAAPLLVPQARNGVQSDPSRLVLRANQCLADNCCVCLGPAETIYSSVFEFACDNLPICWGCRRRLRLKWWLFSLLLIPAIAACAWVLLLPWGNHIDFRSRLAGVVIATVFAPLYAVPFIPNLLIRPGTYKVIDATRGVARFWFRNRAYTKLCQELLAKADLVPIRLPEPPPLPGERGGRQLSPSGAAIVGPSASGSMEVERRRLS